LLARHKTRRKETKLKVSRLDMKGTKIKEARRGLRRRLAARSETKASAGGSVERRKTNAMPCHATQHSRGYGSGIRATGQVFGAERLALVTGAHLPPRPRTCTTDRGTHFTKPNALILGSKLSRHCFTYTSCRADASIAVEQAGVSSLARAILDLPSGGSTDDGSNVTSIILATKHYEVHCTSLEQSRH